MPHKNASLATLRRSSAAQMLHCRHSRDPGAQFFYFRDQINFFLPPPRPLNAQMLHWLHPGDPVALKCFTGCTPATQGLSNASPATPPRPWRFICFLSVIKKIYSCLPKKPATQKCFTGYTLAILGRSNASLPALPRPGISQMLRWLHPRDSAATRPRPWGALMFHWIHFRDPGTLKCFTGYMSTTLERSNASLDTLPRPGVS